MHTAKVITAVVVLLVSVISISIFAFNTLTTTSSLLDQYIGQIEASTARNDWNSAMEQLERVENSWEKTHRTWSMLIDHIEIDHIDATLSRMSKYIESKDTVSALAEAALLRQYIQHIPEKEALNWENIL